jgi:hypothetical protein
MATDPIVKKRLNRYALMKIPGRNVNAYMTKMTPIPKKVTNK